MNRSSLRIQTARSNRQNFLRNNPQIQGFPYSTPSSPICTSAHTSRIHLLKPNKSLRNEYLSKKYPKQIEERRRSMEKLNLQGIQYSEEKSKENNQSTIPQQETNEPTLESLTKTNFLGNLIQQKLRARLNKHQEPENVKKIFRKLPILKMEELIEHKTVLFQEFYKEVQGAQKSIKSGSKNKIRSNIKSTSSKKKYPSKKENSKLKNTKRKTKSIKPNKK